MRFRDVLLVIVLLLAGVVVYQAQTGNWGIHFGDGDEEFMVWGGRAFTFEESRTVEAPLPARLEVDNSHGWVEVRGDDQETVRLTFQKKIWRRNEAEARAVADKLQCKIDRSADRLLLATNREEFMKRNFETGFILTVPRRLTVVIANSYGLVKASVLQSVDVRNRHGQVSVSDIEGACVLESSYEDIEAGGLKADCRITNKHADVQVIGAAGDLQIDHAYGEVRFEDIGGKADISGSHSEVTGRRVQGPVFVETSYEKISLTDTGAARVRARHCPVEANGIRGGLDVETTYEPVKAVNILGDLRVNGNNVEVTGSLIKGREISIETSYDDVDLADFSAKVAVSLRHGNLVLRPSDLKFPIDVRAEYSDIDFYWPAGETVPLEAQSHGGSVHWGLSGRPAVEKSNGTSVIKAFVENAGGPGVSLSTSYGEIRLQEKR